MSLAVELKTDEEMFSVEVGEDILDGWEIIIEGHFEGLVGEVKKVLGRNCDKIVHVGISETFFTISLPLTLIRRKS